MPKIQVPKKLKPLITKKKRFKVIIGGRGSAKSTTVADLCLADSQLKGLMIGQFREFQNSIEDSVYSLLTEEIDRLGMTGFSVQNNKIDTDAGGGMRFRGLARNIQSVKSMHGFDRFVVEEAQFLSYPSLKILTPTLREDESELWFIANPMSSADPFSQRFIVPFQRELERKGYYEDDLHLIIVCNYTDNPFFPEVLEQERAYDEIHLSKAEYEHIWLGKFNDTIENAIIPVEWFDAAIDAHLKGPANFKPLGAKVVAHDPSDEGPDAKGLALRHGSVVLDVQEMDTGDVNDGCDWATQYALDHGADHFTWDCDGLGVTLRRQVQQAFAGTRVQFKMFKGSEGVEDPDEIYQEVGKLDLQTDSRTNKQVFKNKRAQYYWRLRDRFYNTYRLIVKNEYIDPDLCISLSSEIENIDQLRAEVCRIPKKANSNGMIQIMSKDEMLSKHKIPSPNMADSLAMSMMTPDIVQTMHIDFASEF